MSIDACIAHAIHHDLDILETLPDVTGLPMEELESYIENYVVSIHQTIRDAILQYGEPYLRSNDSAGLCATLIQNGIHLPPRMLLKMCRTILKMSELDAKFILDTEDGKTLYFMKMSV